MVRSAETHSVFTYGTLVFPEVMAALTGTRLPHREAVLPGYRRFLVRGRVYPAIVVDPQARTDGVLYENMDSSSLELLDRFEGELYQRERVTVLAQDRVDEHVFAYVLDPSRRAELTDEPWDPAEFATVHLDDYTEGCRAFRREEGS